MNGASSEDPRNLELVSSLSDPYTTLPCFVELESVSVLFQFRQGLHLCFKTIDKGFLFFLGGNLDYQILFLPITDCCCRYRAFKDVECYDFRLFGLQSRSTKPTHQRHYQGTVLSQILKEHFQAARSQVLAGVQSIDGGL